MGKKGLFKNLEPLKEFIINVFFPKFCLGCGKEGSYACSRCQVFVSEALPVCPVCGKESSQGKTHSQCRQRHSLDGLTLLWDYEGLVKKLIYTAKTKGLFDIFSESVENLFKTILSDPERFSAFLSFLKSGQAFISYVPMSRKEKRKRNFNQAEIIAKKVGEFIDVPIIPLLEKKREGSQEGLGKEERFENIKGAFDIKEDLRGIENVLLVDDIFVSGATMKECSRILKKSGIKRVWGFAIARDRR